MANTDLGYYRNDPYIGGLGFIMWFKAGDGSMKAGYLCKGHATNANELIINPTDGNPFGVVGLRPDLGVDDLISDDEPVFAYPLGQGTLMKLKHDGTDETIELGKIIARSNTVAGAVENFTYVADTSELASAMGRGAELKATGGVAIWIDALISL